jgi:hypothetical protein
MANWSYHFERIRECVVEQCYSFHGWDCEGKETGLHNALHQPTLSDQRISPSPSSFLKIPSPPTTLGTKSLTHVCKGDILDPNNSNILAVFSHHEKNIHTLLYTLLVCKKGYITCYTKKISDPWLALQPHWLSLYCTKKAKFSYYSHL